MARGEDSITVEGIVQQGSLDAIHLSPRVCIVSADGHAYEVEPSYVGRYLERFEGEHVIAQVRPVINGKNRSVIRILTLKVLGKSQLHSSWREGRGPSSADPDNPECLLSELELGRPST